ncbi:MAG: TIGR03790 family protein [Phycisphaerales bacterium]|nr:TIGR03790 family protein [Phycisphaerales bacterium]
MKSRRDAWRPAIVSTVMTATGLFFPATAQLTPDQCALIYNGKSEASRELAMNYAGARSIPRDQMLALDAPLRESVTRADYDRLAATIRAFLAGEAMSRRDIRCLVTFYDVPLKVEAVKPDESDVRQADALALRRSALESDWTGKLKEASAALPPRVQALVDRDVAADRDDPALRTNRLLRRWWEHGKTLPVEEQPDERRRLMKWIGEVQGLTAILAATNGADASDLRTDGLERTRQEAARAEAEIARGMASLPGEPAFDRWIAALQTSRGLAGAVQLLTQRIESLTPTDSEGAFDSELALVLHEDVSLTRWTANPACMFNPVAPIAPAESPRILMVARIDAPTPALARRLITDALAVEKSGLTGTFYIDARGLKDGAYCEYDDDLRMLATWTRTHTKLAVALDDRPEVFAEGSAPDAALYCGWYSLAKYVPALKPRPGAVGFHIASFELASLRREDKPYWCAGLLRDGFAATLGPTSEPYLTAFPRPTAFFALLMSGELTLVECYWRTNPMLSWRMALIGDPLYRPFARNPQYPLRTALESLQPKGGQAASP